MDFSAASHRRGVGIERGREVGKQLAGMSKKLLRLLKFIFYCIFKVARSEHHSRERRGALKPLGFFGKLAYMGNLLFQVVIDLFAATKCF